jgi:hypothetical protein
MNIQQYIRDEMGDRVPPAVLHQPIRRQILGKKMLKIEIIYVAWSKKRHLVLIWFFVN